MVFLRKRELFHAWGEVEMIDLIVGIVCVIVGTVMIVIGVRGMKRGN